MNHPSILFWDNGNEGGWKRDNDGEFARWDPQRRPVLHPWAIHSGINTDHYENYDSTVKLSAGPDIFMPTEFLHGLYDGGIGAGLRDYWDVMGSSPTVAGGFFWAFADEGVERTDRDGRIDNMGNSAPDGMLGARHEKEGSFFAVKQIWSPVQITNLAFEPNKLRMRLENHYDFLDLERCSLRWRALRLPAAGTGGSAVTLAEGSAPAPALAPTSESGLADGRAGKPWRRRDDRAGGARSDADAAVEMGNPGPGGSAADRCDFENRESARRDPVGRLPVEIRCLDRATRGAGDRWPHPAAARPRVDRVAPRRGREISRMWPAQSACARCGWRLPMSPECWRVPASTVRCARSHGWAAVKSW